MTLFPAEFSPRAAREIQKLDPLTKKRIGKKIDSLEADPFPRDVKRVESYKDDKVFRVRVGDQRILYAVRYNPNRLIIVKVDERGRVYD